eukprot:8089119-Pyramimonas_sp.AAC.1
MAMDPTNGGTSHVLSIRPTSEAIKKAQRATEAPSQTEVRQQVQQGVQQALASTGDLNNIKILAQQGVDLATKAVDALTALQGGMSTNTATAQQVLVATQGVRDEVRRGFATAETAASRRQQASQEATKTLLTTTLSHLDRLFEAAESGQEEDSVPDAAPAVGRWQMDRLHQAASKRRLAFNERTQVMTRLPYPAGLHPPWPHPVHDAHRREQPAPARKTTNWVGGLRERRSSKGTTERAPPDLPGPRGQQRVGASPRSREERAHRGCRP